METVEFGILNENAFLSILENRFHVCMHRHPDLMWEDVKQNLLNNTTALSVLWRMEALGGEPDVIEYDSVSSKYLFVDCVKESPKSRRNVCYDREALDARKKFKPLHCALDLAGLMGAKLLNVEQYHKLQKIDSFDTKSSNWLFTPPEIRQLGGALFGVNRYKTVFIYPNSAESYFSDRGFRTCVYI